jgi:glutamate-ammonia-ligase adenylyltransferase
VRRFADNPRTQGLRDETKVRIAKLVQRAVEEIRTGSCTPEAAIRFVDWIEPLLRRESYLALLVERPNVQRRLLRLLGLARWPMRYLMLHPGVIDELADERTMVERFDPAALAAELD